MPPAKPTSRRWWRILGRWAGPIAAVLVALVAGWLVRAGCEPVPSPPHDPVLSPPHDHGTHDHGTMAAPAAEDQTLYVCPMNISYHPYFSSTDPDTPCAYCGMPLVPADAGGGRGRTELSEAAIERMDLQTAPVQRRFPVAEVRLVGTVDYDETSLAHITAWVGGRIERMFVDYTGMPVRRGDHLVELYSPELLSAQEELLQAVKAAKNLQDRVSGFSRERTEALADIARDRLRLWGLTDDQIAEIEQRGSARDRVTIYAPTGGIVIEKNVREGAYVQTGTRIYTIADLSRLWVNLKAYESDLVWLRYGQQVQFTTEAAPGRTFEGTISFIAPVLTPATRTVSVRVNVDNAQGVLKPGMFVRAVVRASVAAGGRVMDPSMAGKWICPMHPSEVADGPGDCGLCEMPLVTTESLGYVPADAAAVTTPLVVPATAVLLTGTRAVVYVEVADAETPTYEWRVIELGARAGDVYIVRQGLAEGERVVVRGAFLIDSERQLHAKPSMMTSAEAPVADIGPDRTVTAPAPAAPAMDEALADTIRDAFRGYFALHDSLAGDDSEAAAAAARELNVGTAADTTVSPGPTGRQWREHAAKLADLAERIAAADTLDEMRRLFEPLSAEMIVVARNLRPPGMTLYRMHCPMAMDNRGADWLQLHELVENPYFGAAMYTCGAVVETYEPGEAGP